MRLEVRVERASCECRVGCRGYIELVVSVEEAAKGREG